MELGELLNMKKILALLFSLFVASCNPAFASQNATVLPTTSPYPGLTMLANINSAFNTFQSNFSGSSAPSTCVNNQLWVDTTNHLLKFTPDCTNWYVLGNFNGGWTAASSGFQQLAVTSTGSANAYVITYSPAPTAYVIGQHYYFVSNFSNTGAATANFNSLGALPLKKQGGVALSSGDIANGEAVDGLYDGTNLQIVSTLSAAGALTLANGTVATTQSATDSTTKVATTAQVQSAIVANFDPKMIVGCVPSSMTGTHTTAAMTVGVCQAIDSTDSVFITGTSYSWAVSNGNAVNGYQGGTTLPNGSTIHFYEIQGTSGTGTFASTSLTPTLPSGYTVYRRIFSLTTDGSGTIMPYTATEIGGGGLLCILNTPNIDYSNFGPFSPITQTVSVPNSINVVGKFFMYVGGASGTQTRSLLWGYGPSALQPQNQLSTGAAFSGAQTEANIQIIGDQSIHLLQAIGADATTFLTTIGWTDPRR